MSLKARIEAVIYAAEEPVTLPQLATLFREEALAARAERMAAEAAAAEAAAEPAEEALPEGEAAEPAQDAVAEVADAAPSTEEQTPSPEPEAGAAEAATPETVSAEDEKKAARQRDREVRDEIRRLIDELIAEYSSAERGLEIREVAGGFRFGTRPEYHDSVRAFVKSLKPPMKLSLQALETLAVIAYKQPITAPEIGEIRGVDSAGVLGSLVARKLVTTAGRKQVVGRPILYKTTKEFLLRFGLRDLNELPSIEEFEKMAGELAEPEEAAAAEELPFAQNEAAAVEEASEATTTTEDVPADDPEAAPTSEHDMAEPAESASVPAEEDQTAAPAEESQAATPVEETES